MPVGGTHYTFSQLEQLWIQAGGSVVYAPIAAAVAEAESSGYAGAYNVNTNGSTDVGLWQINNGGQGMYDPLANAKRAVQMSNNGTNWRPWCTAYSDGACGSRGGSYMASGTPALRYLASNGGGNTPPSGGNGPSGTGIQSTANTAGSSGFSTQDAAWAVSAGLEGGLIGALSDALKTILQLAFWFGAGIAGMILAMVGLFLIFRATNINVLPGVRGSLNKLPGVAV